MRRIFRVLLAGLLLLASTAWGSTVALVLSDDSRPYTEFSTTLGESLADSSWRIARYPAESIASQTLNGDIIVTAGSDALRKLLARGASQPVIATLLTKQGFDRIISEFTALPRRITVIHLDQPHARQIAFVKALLPDARRIGMLISSETRSQLPRFKQLLSARGMSLESEESDGEANLLPALNGLLPRVDALLASPDSQIFRRGNVKPILITAFRNQKPLIGYSDALTQAGALASLYSTPAQIARQTATLLISGNPATWPSSLVPAQFTLSVNYNVAQSLGLKVPEESALRQALLTEGESR